MPVYSPRNLGNNPGRAILANEAFDELGHGRGEVLKVWQEMDDGRHGAKHMVVALHKDAKSEFQVWAQARFNVTPHYRVIHSEGPDHARMFTVQVRLGEESWGEGRGRSKQAAAQAAAAEALQRAEIVSEAE